MFDNTILLLLPAILLSMYAQFKVSSTFNKFSQTASTKGLTGAEVAAKLLLANGVKDVKIQQVAGSLTDHYDPAAKVVRLSESVYGQRSLAALGVAAHEVGHALQHNENYAPLAFRSGLFPVTTLCSRLSLPILLLGMFMGASPFGIWMLYAGIIMFSFVFLFQVITLPVEFNASSRAVRMLESERLLSESETVPAKRVLDAAALTYVAAVIMTALQLLRFVMIARGRS